VVTVEEKIELAPSNGWRGQFLFFVVPRHFSQDICEWPENQSLIPDWTYFHCPGATLVVNHLFIYN